MLEPRLSLVTLGVEDLARARAFYEALGWQCAISPDSPEYNNLAAFDLNGFCFGLYPRDKLAEDANVPPEGSGFRGVALAYNVRDKAEVAQIIQAAVAAGGQCIKPAEDTFWGGHSGYFTDPDGHLWEVAHNPFSPLGEDGAFRWNGVG